MTSTRDSVTGTMSAFALELEIRVSLTAARHDQGSDSAIVASIRGLGANGTLAAKRLGGRRTRRSPPPHERPPVRTSTRIGPTVSPSFPYSARPWNRSSQLRITDLKKAQRHTRGGSGTGMDGPQFCGAIKNPTSPPTTFRVQKCRAPPTFGGRYFCSQFATANFLLPLSSCFMFPVVGNAPI